MFEPIDTLADSRLADSKVTRRPRHIAALNHPYENTHRCQ